MVLSAAVKPDMLDTPRWRSSDRKHWCSWTGGIGAVAAFLECLTPGYRGAGQRPRWVVDGDRWATHMACD